MMLFLTTLLLLQTPQNQDKAALEKKQVATDAAAHEGTRSLMMIDPKDRVTDYLKAFEFLSQEKSSSKVVFDLSSGMKLTNVIEIKPLPSNTLMLFRMNTPQGVKYQVVEIEDILGISHQ